MLQRHLVKSQSSCLLMLNGREGHQRLLNKTDTLVHEGILFLLDAL